MNLDARGRRQRRPRATCVSVRTWECSLGCETRLAALTGSADERYAPYGPRRSVGSVMTVVKVVRVLLILMLAVLTISLVMALGTDNTGPIEKVVLVILIAGCVY